MLQYFRCISVVGSVAVYALQPNHTVTFKYGIKRLLSSNFPPDVLPLTELQPQTNFLTTAPFLAPLTLLLLCSLQAL